jgi:D-proline reductase (dithiol) PrdB
MVVDSYRFLPRSFRPFYEGRGPYPGEESPVWAPFEKRLSASRIALLTSAGVYLKASQASFDVEGEQSNPEWGDPTWRSIPATARPDEMAVAHLHINDEDALADPEIALPMRGLAELVEEGIVGGAVVHHVAVMGYQDRGLDDWRSTTAPEIVAHLRGQGADGLILAPA